MTGFVFGMALLGLAIGTLLTSVVWRVPRGEPVFGSPSCCPGCAGRISISDQIPVLSRVLLRGRCRRCGAPVSARYPVVEGLTGLLFAALAAVIGASWQLPAYLYLAAISVALAFIDYDTKRLPDAITLPSYPVLAGLLLVPTVIDEAWLQFGRALAAGLALFAFYLIAALIVPAGMGLGDVKLAGILGMALGWLGWGVLFGGAFAGFLLAALVGVALMIAGRAARSSAIPFGPFMVAGAMLAVLLGPALVER
ncbi:MAG: prepilin peptidase [Candidatus Nanopelagicales bacterium]